MTHTLWCDVCGGKLKRAARSCVAPMSEPDYTGMALLTVTCMYYAARTIATATEMTARKGCVSQVGSTCVDLVCSACSET